MTERKPKRKPRKQTAAPVERRVGSRNSGAVSNVADNEPLPRAAGPTTRKTIEIPENYFFQVKERAVQRRIKEKHLWSEIVAEYFERHPEA